MQNNLLLVISNWMVSNFYTAMLVAMYIITLSVFLVWLLTFYKAKTFIFHSDSFQYMYIALQEILHTK